MAELVILNTNREGLRNLTMPTTNAPVGENEDIYFAVKLGPYASVKKQINNDNGFIKDSLKRSFGDSRSEGYIYLASNLTAGGRKSRRNKSRRNKSRRNKSRK